jgi:hypothetical protein
VPRICQCHKEKGRVSYPPLLQLVEPMGVEPTTSRVRFQLRARQRQDTTRKLSQIKTHVGECRRLFGYFTHTTALVHGQKADNFSVKSSVALLIAYLMVCSNPKRHQHFSIAVRELSVSFTRRRKWKNKRSARGAAMKDARIARQIHGQHCAMVVASAKRGLRRF